MITNFYSFLICLTKKNDEKGGIWPVPWREDLSEYFECNAENKGESQMYHMGFVVLEGIQSAGNTSSILQTREKISFRIEIYLNPERRAFSEASFYR